MGNEARGRPLKYKSKKKLQAAIDAYFEECDGIIATDSSGNLIYDKNGKPVIFKQRPPTVTGLALALGFTSRQALINYQNRDEFFDTITRAKMIIEKYNEERLFDKDGVNGAKFNLINNFEGWKEKQEVDSNVNEKGKLEVEINVIE